MNPVQNNNRNSPPPSANDPSSSASKIYLLKKAREEKGLSLENVHETTKIPMDVLRAIEDGYRVKSVSPFYYKSFIKIYATFLEVNPSEILESMVVQKEEAPKLPTRIPIPPPMQSMPEFNTSEWMSRTFTPERKKQVGTFVVIVVGLFIVFKVLGWIKYKWTHRPVKIAAKIEDKKEKNISKIDKKEQAKTVVKETPKEVKVTIKEEKPVIQEVSSVIPPPVQNTQTSSASVTKNVTLTARAKKSIWLSVKADGVVVFQSTLGSGSVETWLANDKIEISGRNLSQLEFELNGKMMGTLGREDRQAKRIVFTKEGLSVSK
jgi:cytoskeletal protein RodZ